MTFIFEVKTWLVLLLTVMI